MDGWMDGTVDGNASTNFCLVGETENLDSSRSLAPALRERYCKSNRIACQSGSSRFAAKKNARWNEVCAPRALERGLNSRARALERNIDAVSAATAEYRFLRFPSPPVSPRLASI